MKTAFAIGIAAVGVLLLFPAVAMLVDVFNALAKALGGAA